MQVRSSLGAGEKSHIIALIRLLHVHHLVRKDGSSPLPLFGVSLATVPRRCFRRLTTLRLDVDAASC